MDFEKVCKIAAKRKEIKEAVRQLIKDNYNARNPSYPNLIAFRPEKFLNELLPLLSSLNVVIEDKNEELPGFTWRFTDKLTSRVETVEEYKERLNGFVKTYKLV